MNDGWITGTASATYQIRASGLDASELFSSATGALDFDTHDGVLPHVALAVGSGPLHINRFWGRFILRDGGLEIQQGKLETPGSIYRLSGTASLSRALDIKLFRDGARGFKISGTLAEPHVEPAEAAETRAALKPRGPFWRFVLFFSLLLSPKLPQPRTNHHQTPPLSPAWIASCSASRRMAHWRIRIRPRLSSPRKKLIPTSPREEFSFRPACNQSNFKANRESLQRTRGLISISSRREGAPRIHSWACSQECMM